MTNLDLTPEQSARNFERRSLLNMMDLVSVLDDWLDQIRDNKLRIGLSEHARSVLRETIRSMKLYVLSSRIPDILPGVTGTRYRYSLDWYRNGLQLGIEKFPDTALFEPDGSEAPPMVDESTVIAEGEVDPEAVPDEPETTYMLVHAVPIAMIPIGDWADQNGIKLGTARQWVSRGRIHASKEAGSLRVSPIQYTPDEYQRAKGLRYRFKFPGQLPEDLVASYPDVLSGMVLDLLLYPDPEDPAFHQMLCIHMDETTKKAGAGSVRIDAAAKDRILSAVYGMEGVKDSMAQFYVSPFGEPVEAGCAHHAQIEPGDKQAARLLRKLRCSGRTEFLPLDVSEDNEDARILQPGHAVLVRFEASDGKHALKLSGSCQLRGESPEAQLLFAIFGWPGVLMDATDAIQAADHRNGTRSGTYPWNKSVLTVDTIESDLPDDVRDAILRGLPGLMAKTLCLEPELVLISKKIKPGPDLSAIGFRDAGKHLYAYARTGKTFTGF